MANEIFFVDSLVRNHEILFSTLPHDSELVILEPNRDGLEQIADYLRDRSGIDSIHIISHGSAGALYLGSTILTADNLGSYINTFQPISHSLTESCDILLYGCNIAAGESGHQFINQLAQMTGADVAASTNMTGSPRQHGDWILEAQTGAIETTFQLQQANYDYLLNNNTVPSFSVGGGTVTTSVGIGSTDHGTSATLQPDGKILIAGYTDNDFALVRINTDGSLDSGFGASGKITTPINSSDDSIYSVAVQVDGKIVVAGESKTGSYYNFALARYNTDGSLDSTFDTDGQVVTSIGTGDDTIYSVVAQPDGAILVAGESSSSGGTFDIALARYTSAGVLDSTFGSGGKVVTGIGADDDSAYSMAIQNDGKILIAGDSFNGLNYDFAMARYNANGSLDTTFGTGGKVTTPIATLNDATNDDSASSMALQSDGKILVAGASLFDGFNYDFALVRYSSNGSLDTSFGSGGKVTTHISGGDDIISSVTLQTDNKILVAGYSFDGSSYDLELARYNTDGSLDISFGNYGLVTATFGYGDDVGLNIVVQDDGRILVSGYTNNGNDGDDDDFALARFNADGNLDLTFNGSNTLNGSQTFNRYSNAVVLENSVQIYDAELAATDSYDGATLTLNRHGGASAKDVFSSSGTLSSLTQGGSLVVSSTTIGTVTKNSSGTLTLTFNSSATQALVNSAMQQIAYSNNSAAAGSVQIDWLFNDGNSGTQGAGGNGIALGSVTVNITADNNAPVVANAIADNLAATGSPFSFSIPASTFNDADPGDKLTYSAKLANGSDLPSWLTFDSATLKLSGTAGNGDIGNLNLRVTAADKSNATVSDDFILAVKTGVNASDPSANAADILQGQAGTVDEILDGGKGADEMAGGGGNDIYVVDNTGDIVTELTGEGTADEVKSSVTFTLGDFIEKITLTGKKSVNATGNGSANTLTGNEGGNILDGGAGADTLIGGKGKDTYIVDNPGDVVQENSTVASEIDTVKSSVSYSLTANVENLILTGADNINGTGNTLKNTIIGNDHDNTLDGGVGVDVLKGGKGNDTYKVDLIRSGTAATAIAKLQDTITELAAQGTDSLILRAGDLGVLKATKLSLSKNFENIDISLTGSYLLSLIGNNSDNVMTGNSGNNALNGGIGADTLDGGAGNDTLDGGAGVDSLIGGAGDDTYILGNEDDIINETAGGIDTVNIMYANKTTSSITLTVGSGAFANIENITVGSAGLYDLTGNASANLLAGNKSSNIINGLGGNDTLNGGVGVDTLFGGSGNDTYIVDSVLDIVDEESNTDTGDVIESTISIDLTQTQYDKIEHVKLTGKTPLNATGDEIANILTGNSGKNTLVGGAGNDSLNGGLGNDNLTGDAGADIFIFDSALKSNADTITDFTSGTDRLQLGSSIFTQLATGTLNAGNFVSEAGATSHDINDHILLDTTTGTLYYDADGNGTSAKAVKFAILTGISDLPATDFIVV